MAKLDALRPLLTDISDPLMQADGYALRLTWPGELNPVVLQTLDDYGGLPVVESSGQALWFFFSEDMLLAAARLSVWARFNSLAIALHIFPAKLRAGESESKNIIIDERFWALDTPSPLDFRIWVHSSLAKTVETTPGLGLVAGKEDDAAIAGWHELDVDARLPYQSRLNWFAMLRPVGNPLDKDFQIGWREFFPHLEAILQRGKFRFIIHDFYLMFPVESLRQLRSWCKDFLALIERLKTELPAQYWPCVMAVVDKKGLNLGEDLPVKSTVPWPNIVPDYPHMTMHTAFSLGSGFVVHSVRFETPKQSPDEWASVSQRKEGEGNANKLPQLSAPSLVLGHDPTCFYCGQTSHAAADCPSRLMVPLETGIWTEVAKLNLDDLQNAMGEVSKALAATESDDERKAYIARTIKEKEVPGIMLRAYYDLAWPVQSRSISFFWRVRGKDISKAGKDLLPMDNNPVWGALEDFLRNDTDVAQKTLQNLSVKFPNDFRVHSLRGFMAMEADDPEKAEKWWKDAERCSPNPAIKAWHSMLQARLLECLGRFSQALVLYEHVVRSLSNWQEPVYRMAVCRVKGGFTQTALNLLLPLIDKNGHIFNRAIIDPELERGYIQVYETLDSLWNTMEQRARNEMGNLAHMREELGSWFVPGNSFALEMAERIENLMQYGTIANYVAFQRLYVGRAALEKDMQAHVLKEAKEYKNRFNTFTERLRVIREESSWFPFPSVLVEFNRSYNKSVANVNWALRTNFHSAESFRNAQALLEEETARLKKLEKRMAFLRIIRDGTLFILSMLETFFWIEVIGLLFIFVIFPLLMLYGDKFGLDMAGSLLANDRWRVQKALFFAVSLIAVTVAVLRTALRFESIRAKILAKAKTKAAAAAVAARSKAAAKRKKTSPAGKK